MNISGKFFDSKSAPNPAPIIASMQQQVSNYNEELLCIRQLSYMFDGRVAALRPAGKDGMDGEEINAFVLVKLSLDGEQPLMALVYPPGSKGEWQILSSPKQFNLKEGTYSD